MLIPKKVYKILYEYSIDELIQFNKELEFYHNTLSNISDVELLVKKYEKIRKRIWFSTYEKLANIITLTYPLNDNYLKFSINCIKNAMQDVLDEKIGRIIIKRL